MYHQNQYIEQTEQPQYVYISLQTSPWYCIERKRFFKMQTFIDQRLVENVVIKKSVMSKFVNLLNKLCIFPITVKNKIQFSFIKFTIYLFWAVTPTLLYYYFLMRSKVYVDFLKQSSSLNKARYIHILNSHKMDSLFW